MSSRNRPRGPPTTNHVEQEELNLWQQLIGDVSKAKELNDKQKEFGQQIAVLNEKIAKDGNSKSQNSPFPIAERSLSRPPYLKFKLLRLNFIITSRLYSLTCCLYFTSMNLGCHYQEGLPSVAPLTGSVCI